jgi:hypothetical protein
MLRVLSIPVFLLIPNLFLVDAIIEVVPVSLKYAYVRMLMKERSALFDMTGWFVGEAVDHWHFSSTV